MKIFQATQCIPAYATGFIFALLGFSFALATSNTDRQAVAGASGRGIGTNGVRRPAEFVTDADLGFVVAGTQFTRQILVRYGYKPHVFSIGASDVTSGGGILAANGTITGLINDPGSQVFDVIVKDPNQPPITKTYFITAIDQGFAPDTTLQFANSATLLSGISNETYAFHLHGNGGTPPYEFGFVSDADFRAFPAGLSLSSDGLIYGKPVAPTTTPATFSLSLTDTTGDSVVRKFTLKVLSGTVSSEFIALSGSFNLNFGKEGGRDSLKLSILLDKSLLALGGIRQASDLTDVNFSMKLGGVSLPPEISGVTFPRKFDKNGEMRFPNLLGGFERVQGNDTEFEIKLNPRTGILKVRFTNLDMIKALDANRKFFGDPAIGSDSKAVRGPILPVNIKIGIPASFTFDPSSSTGVFTDATVDVNYEKTDIVKFVYERRGTIGAGSAQSNQKLAPAGLFMITKVRGSELQINQLSDRLFLTMTGFIRQPGGNPIVPGATDDVQIMLNDFCIGVFPASSFSQNGDVLTFFNTDTTAGLRSLTIDNKAGTIKIDTHGLNPNDLFGVDILSAGVPYTLPITLTISSDDGTDANFDGQSSVTLFRTDSKIKNK